MNLNNEYLAGLLDGEAWFGISIQKAGMAGGRTRYLPQCRLVNTHIEILTAIREKYNAGQGLMKTAKSTGYKDVYHVRFYGIALRNLLADVLPFLIIKKDVALIVLECLNSMTLGKGRTKRTTDAQLEYRRQLYLQTRKINSYCSNKPYVPTEANMPVMEAGRLFKPTPPKDSE